MWSDNKHSLLFRQIHQQTEGYREQESNRKNQFFLRYSKHRPNGNSLSFTSMYYIGSWDLPGSINAEEVNDNPQMARPYSLSANASVDKTYLLNALTYASDEYSRTTHKTSIFLNNNDKINPYGTSPFFAGYKDENSVVIGLRNSSQTTIDDFRTISYGGEFQSEYGKYKEYTNNEGEKDILKYNNKTNFFSGNLFTSYRRIFRRYRFNFGVNAQIFNYSNEGYSDVLDSTLSAKKFYKPVVLPSIEIKKSIFTNSQVYILTRRGNSWPGLFELVDVETGFINRNLQIENTLLLESGIMGYSDNDIGYSFDIYTQALQNPILPGIDSLERISYYNGKNSHYFGAEFSINKLIEPKRIVKRIYIAAHGAFQRYYADKKLALLMPGVPLSTAGIEVRINHQSGLQLDVLHRYTDRLPLNDDNSTFLSSNHIIHANLSWTKNIKNFSFQLSAGINNISNTSYTGFPQLNATLGRYYNPAALQNYFAGFRLTYKVIKN
jgi:iron complex outermembrane receptor protein